MTYNLYDLLHRQIEKYPGAMIELPRGTKFKKNILYLNT